MSTISNEINPPSDPISDGHLWMADGGLETTLVFHHGLDLPDFAAFPLVGADEGREHLRRYFRPYLAIAADQQVGMVLDTPTWRANRDWGTRLGYSEQRLADANADAVTFVRELIAEAGDGLNGRVAVNGVIGPRGDGYVVGEAMSDVEAAHYHALQTRTFARAGVDLITAVTMTYAAEAIGIVKAARSAGKPVVISFTTETDGRLPSGQSLGAVINEVDKATDHGPLFYMINCAHPSHFKSTLDPAEPWLERIGAIRANASRMSHEELDNATELDPGDASELADDYRELRDLLPNLRVVGGCCGTDRSHVEQIVNRLIAQ